MGDASETLAATMVAALRGVAGLSQVADGAPIQAGDAHAVVEIGPETDWGHKCGAGAEVRFALLIRCAGEDPARARRLLGEVRAAAQTVGPELGGWRLVTLAMTRSRVMREAGPRWTGVLEYRARMLSAE